MSTSTFVQRINGITGAAEWVQEPADYDYHQEVARSAYADMLHDHDRNMKYYKALALAVQKWHRRGEQAIVLDIGTGTGLLSMMAAKLGADKIYACEAFAPMAKCAKRVISDNSFTDKIKLIPKRSTELKVGSGEDMASRANILVTEVFDTELIGEGAIGTYNHAHDYLLSEGALLVPTKAVCYAQVVHCPAVAGWNKLNPIRLQNGTFVAFPKDVAKCSGIPSVHDIQLSEIKENQFTQLSDPVPIFEFDWAENSRRIPLNGASSVSFTSKASDPSTAVFMWWDLQMSSLADKNLPSNIITMKPSWAGDDYVWRDHWMQAVYHISNPVPFKKGGTYTLQSFHDEYSFWFNIRHGRVSAIPSGASLYPESPICTCGVHLGMSRSRIGLFNDIEQREKYLRILTPVVNKETVAVVLSECSPLPFILIALGAKKVFLRESNGFGERAMKKLVHYAGFEGKINFVDDFEKGILSEHKIDLVVGEPFFHDAVLPWHNLCYWYFLQKLKPVFSCEVQVLPGKAVIRGVVVEYRDLWKIRSKVGTVCNGDFDITHFDDLIENSCEISDSVIDAQPLWEYPSTTCSSAFTLLKFNFLKSIQNMSFSHSIPAYGKPNGVALWIEWLAPDGSVMLSSGPRCDSSMIVPGISLDWNPNCKQGVYFFPDPLSRATICCQASFLASTGKVELSFES